MLCRDKEDDLEAVKNEVKRFISSISSCLFGSCCHLICSEVTLHCPSVSIGDGETCSFVIIVFICSCIE